jgi:TrmH family RNA methyltransferase
MEGQPVHDVRFPKGGLLVMGNESHGVNHELTPYISHKIAIPSYGHAESLNVAVATAVICDNIRRTNGQ